MAHNKNADKARASIGIMRAIGIGRVRPTLVTGSDGSRPIVIALASEYAGEVFERVGAIGGPVNLIIAFGKSFKVLTINGSSDVCDAELVINEDLSMGMLDIRMSQNPGKTVGLQFADSGVVAQSQGSFAYA